jgi:hypothetical protein
MTILVVGGTGTLGRQIVRESLQQGFEVKCLIRSFGRSAFLKKWGSTLVYGDLASPETIPTAFKGIRIVVDTSTIRSSDNYRADHIEWTGKLALLESAILAKIKLFVFFTLMVPEAFVPKIPLLELKRKFIGKLTALRDDIHSLIYHLDGFFQGLLEQYALPVLEKEKIWLTKTQRPLAYINSQDAAKQVLTDIAMYELKVLTKPKHIVLYGLRFLTPIKIIDLCERLSGQQANTSYLPTYIIFGLRTCLRLFEFTWNIADRLQYYDLLERPLLPRRGDRIITGSYVRDNIRIPDVLFTDKDLELIAYEGEPIIDPRRTGNRESIESYLRDYFLLMRRGSFVESKKSTISALVDRSK